MKLMDRVRTPDGYGYIMDVVRGTYLVYIDETRDAFWYWEYQISLENN